MADKLTRLIGRAIAPLRIRRTRLRNWAVRNGWRSIAPLDTFHQWVREPQSMRARKVCLLATFSADGSVAEHTLLLARGWSEEGFDVVLIIATAHPERVASDWAGPLTPGEQPYLRGIMTRRNSGYDFGSWATAIQARCDLFDASLLVLANDSLYGPLAGFGRLLERVYSSNADIVGMTDSYEYLHHFQSYLVFYKTRALHSNAFRRFWNGVRGGDREDTIHGAELVQMGAMKKGGLNVEVLFPTPPHPLTNPTLLGWRELLDRGFPFVKVQLLRENPWGANIDGWDGLMRERGYDPAIVRKHLGERFAASAAAASLVGRHR